MNLKKAIIGSLAVVSTLAVAGCGSATDISKSQGQTLTKQDFAAAMVSATSQARSVHVTGDISAQGQHVTLSADAAMNGTSVTDLAVALKANVAGMGSVQMRIVSGVVYVNAGTLAPPGTFDKPWMRVDVTDPSNPLGAAFAKLAAMSPAELMKAFESVSTLTEMGTETIDGVRTTHYKVVVDMSKMAGMLGMPLQGHMATMPKTVCYEAWVDSSMRPIKLMMNNPMFRLEVHFSKWGVPVHVVAPPASQVGDFSLGASLS